MNSFQAKYIQTLSVPIAVSIMLSFCSEAKGMEKLWDQTRPEVLETLKQQSIISSTESSNRIEGVEVDRKRLEPLIKGKAAPRDRSEEEIVGYKNALNWIHQSADSIDVTPKNIRRIHEIAESGTTSDAGKWKIKNNEIIEIHEDGNVSIRFVPVEPKQVPEMMQNLCLAYKDAVQNSKLPELLLIINFVFDFLCIHPFRDGNGRTARLLTLLLLYHHGYHVGRYISIEKIIEDSKDSYYEALHKSSDMWHEGKHDLTPVWLYFTRTVKVAYDYLKNKVQVENFIHGGKTGLIRQAVLRQSGKFSIGDIVGLEKGMSRALVKKVLYQLREEGKIKLHGKGRGAYWVLV